MSGRARRAVALMVVAAVSIGAVSIYYLRPWTLLHSGVATKPVSAAPTPLVDHLTNYHFVSTALGWAVVAAVDPINNSQSGPYWVYRTVDAGKHWQRQLSGRTARLFLTFSSLWFADAYTGYVVGGDPVALYRTHDGGQHWATAALPTPDVQDIEFVDGADAFAMTSTAPQEVFVYQTGDGGMSWRRLPDLPQNLGFWPHFRTPDEAWSGAEDVQAYVYVTVDGGATWERRSVPTPADIAGPMSTVVEAPASGAVVFAFVASEATQASLLYSSVDHGTSWRRVRLPSETAPGAPLVAFDATHWWFADGASTLYRTDDGGISWTEVGQWPPNLRLITVIDAHHAWGAEDGPDNATELMLTSDGGASWTPTNSPHPA